jgi:hypothetical protein
MRIWCMRIISKFDDYGFGSYFIANGGELFDAFDRSFHYTLHPITFNSNGKYAIHIQEKEPKGAYCKALRKPGRVGMVSYHTFDTMEELTGIMTRKILGVEE